MSPFTCLLVPINDLDSIAVTSLRIKEGLNGVSTPLGRRKPSTPRSSIAGTRSLIYLKARTGLSFSSTPATISKAMGILLYSLHVLLVSVLPFSNAHRRERLSLGDSLSIDREGDELVSPNGTFAAGFIQVGENAYCFSIWYARRPGKKTVVWMANRDKPVTTTVSEIHLNKYGTLVLISGGEGKVWETNTAFRRDVKELELLETGNLVLTNGNGEFVWQSFASPTDTLLPGQQLTRNTVLVSKRDAGNYLSGSYSFKFNDDNVVYLIYSGPEVSSVYFPLQDSAVYAQGRTNFNSTRLAAMDDMGTFSSSDLFHFNSSDYGRGPHRRLTLDHDGLLRVYSMKEPNWEWKVVWFLDIGSVGFTVCAEATASASTRRSRRARVRRDSAEKTRRTGLKVACHRLI
ncbi:unnamed protein product [Spirodela intermedia]|uniref:Bulb-type lectin domain-containing protein n=1 Tax=Spirodela intermedia TaxID=51605 RepID=A0A7I8J2W2_SPIIN|nr:unnamed protein product [Spirodela intermedia]CAA6664468.1 unnamed protein product [Spirodela intermedia]